MKNLFTISLLLIFTVSCKNIAKKSNTENTTAKTVQTQLSDSIKMMVDSIVVGVSKRSKVRMTAVVSGDGVEPYYSGYDGRSGMSINDFSSINEIGSNTKMFTATSILQLMEQKKLSLNDPITSILPDAPIKDLLIINGKNYIDSVKVINLLNHSSGLPEYFIEHDDDKEIALHGDPSLVFTANDLIGMAKKLNLNLFIPGTSFRYCNTNYILLGMIIEKLSGQTYQEYFKEHIIAKLNLKNTYLGTVNPPATRAQGHFKGNPSFIPFTLAGPAGEIVMSLGDMEIFISNWYKGNLFQNPSTLQVVLKDNYLSMGSGLLYGMGVINMMNISYGHAGQTFGFQSYMASLPNNYRFAFAIDEASVAAWNPAIVFSMLLSPLK